MCWKIRKLAPKNVEAQRGCLAGWQAMVMVQVLCQVMWETTEGRPLLLPNFYLKA